MRRLPREAAAILLIETDGHPAAVADEAAQIEQLCRDHGASSVRRAANATEAAAATATQRSVVVRLAASWSSSCCATWSTSSV